MIQGTGSGVGKSIFDRCHLGLGLFDLETTFDFEIITPQVELITVESIILKGRLTCHGYEIHMGRNTFKTPYCSLFSSPEDENPMNFGII